MADAPPTDPPPVTGGPGPVYLPPPDPPPITSGPSYFTPPTGRYATQADVERRFGVENVAAWSNLTPAGRADEGPPTADPAAVQSALDDADAWVDLMLAGGPHATPLSGALALSRARRWASTYAGWSLYQSRGVPLDKAAAGTATKYDALVEQAEREIRQCKAGMTPLDAPRRWPGPTGPTAW